MSQTLALRALDADIMAGMQGAGFADAALYSTLVGPPVAVEVYVDRAAQFFGPDGMEVAGFRTTVTLFRAQVPRPVRGSTVVVDGETLTLDQIDLQDESMSRWVVLP